LATALASLADTPSIRVEIGEVAEERYPSAVETAAYVFVVEAIDSAVSRGATRAAVGAIREDGQLVVTVEDDGFEPRAPSVQLVDRVGAVGGSMDVGGNGIRAGLPCA
jgi:signal transduction histidine kinase